LPDRALVVLLDFISDATETTALVRTLQEGGPGLHLVERAGLQHDHDADWIDDLRASIAGRAFGMLRLCLADADGWLDPDELLPAAAVTLARSLTAMLGSFVPAFGTRAGGAYLDRPVQRS